MNEVVDHEEIVRAVLRRVAAEEGLELGELHPSSSLVDELGLRSMQLARVLAILELEFDFDPFASGDLAITSVRTVGDLCNAYHRS